ncbi:MAG: winged helix-turn-helix domain-containing protein, partial [Acidimicrobiales bacterium]
MARPLQVGDEAILAALTARPEVTSAEVAAVLGIGQSTAAKRLAALEATGSARRAPGGRAAGRRTPD